MLANKKTSFFKDYREKGVPASQVPPHIVEPLVERVMSAPEEQLLAVGEVQPREWEDPPHSFSSFVCERCGEMTVATRQGSQVRNRSAIPIRLPDGSDVTRISGRQALNPYQNTSPALYVAQPPNLLLRSGPVDLTSPEPIQFP